MVIWKFELRITEVQEVLMPAGAELLSVADQHGNLCLWAMVDPSEHHQPRVIEIVGTGNPMQSRTDVELNSSNTVTESGARIERKFIGTVVMNPFVWHVFERLN